MIHAEEIRAVMPPPSAFGSMVAGGFRIFFGVADFAVALGFAHAPKPSAASRLPSWSRAAPVASNIGFPFW